MLEAARLASALAVELQALLEHYEDNLSLLASEASMMLSIRAPGAVFRGNTGRLTGLIGERILAPLVAVYANHERIEALLQLQPKPNAGQMKPVGPAKQNVAPRVPAPLEELYRRRMQERFRVGRHLAETALAAITAAWPLLQAEGPDAAGFEIHHDKGALLPAE